MSPSIEYRLSQAISFGRSGPAARSSSSRCAMSLWRKIWRSQPAWRMPSIIELWFSASDRIRQFGISLAMVAMPVWFET